MPRYNCEMMDKHGDETEEIIEANTETEATQIVRQKGYFATRVQLYVPPTKTVEEPKHYPGLTSTLIKSTITLVKDLFYATIAATILACLIWFIGKICTFNPNFWATQRWTILIVAALITAVDVFRLHILLPLGISIYAREWKVPYGQAQAAIHKGIIPEIKSERPNTTIDAEYVRKFLWRERISEGMVKTVMKSIKFK